MKTALASLTGVLYDTNVQKLKEVYTVDLQSGTHLYWTSAEANVVSGSTTWVPVGITRGSGRAATGVEVATMDITIYPGTLLVDGVSASLAAVQGAFDSARVKVERRYNNGLGTIFTTLFDGDVVDVKPASTRIELTVKSGLVKLDLPFPPRQIQAQCAWQLFDSNCGIASGSWEITYLASAGTNKSQVPTGATLGTNDYLGGLLHIDNGAMSGLTRTITSNTTSYFVVSPPLPQNIAAGVSFTVKPGCPKTRQACKVTFNNIARFGGFADVPAPEKK